MKTLILSLCLLVSGAAFAADNKAPTCDAECLSKKMLKGCKEGDQACYQKKRAESYKHRPDTSIDFDMGDFYKSAGMSEPKAAPDKNAKKNGKPASK